MEYPVDVNNIDYNEIHRRASELRAQALKDIFSSIVARIHELVNSVEGAFHRTKDVS